MANSPSSETARVRAVLGPTNTGKTHFAIERMLGHGTGMIGFPLRLLARENYDRVVKLKGASAVALVTGEEKILPPRPRYWVCTVRSMPLDQQVDRLAVDEIQLAGDAERGHIFTEPPDAAPAAMIGDAVPGLRHCPHPDPAPGARVVGLIQRDRLSTLTYAGAKEADPAAAATLAIVAFSAAEVYQDGRGADPPAEGRLHRRW